MAKGTRICKVCGAEYPYCKTNRPTGTFRWQDVACSPEHGSIYLFRIMESRSPKSDPEPVQVEAGSAIAAVEARLAKQRKADDQEDPAVDDVVDVVEEDTEIVVCETSDAVYEIEESADGNIDDEEIDELSDEELDGEEEDDDDDDGDDWLDDDDEEGDWIDDDEEDDWIDGDEDENN